FVESGQMRAQSAPVHGRRVAGRRQSGRRAAEPDPPWGNGFPGFDAGRVAERRRAPGALSRAAPAHGRCRPTSRGGGVRCAPHCRAVAHAAGPARARGIRRGGDVMISAWTAVTAGGIRWCVAPEYRDWLIGADGLPLATWLRDGKATAIKRGPHRQVYRVELPGLSFYV